MIYFLKYFKGIAYFLTMLILFQSCIAYNKTSSTIEEATSDEEMPINIITKDGKEHKFRFIEEKNGNIVGIKKVEKKHYQKKDVLDYAILDPEIHTVPLDTALKHHGTIRLLVKEGNESYNSHEFIKISQTDEWIIGYNTQSVIIPIDQIEKIQLKDVKKSRNDSIALAVIGVGVLAATAFSIGFALAAFDL